MRDCPASKTWRIFRGRTPLNSPELYGDPSYYDILMTPGTAREMAVLAKIAHRRLSSSDRPLPWFEPACGTGRCLRHLAARGHQAVGYDLDPTMTAYARRSLSRRQFEGVQVLDLDMSDSLPSDLNGRFGLAFNPWNSIRHLENDRALVDHLQQIAHALTPGGIYVVGISLTSGDGSIPEEDIWSATRGRCRIVQMINWVSSGPRFERAHVQTLVQRPRGEEIYPTTYDLRTYTHVQWRRLLERSPLHHLETLDVQGRPFPGEGLAYQLDVLGRR